MNYQEFLESKQFKQSPCGFDVAESEINETLFDFQKSIVRWALKRGKAAIFADTGLGKSFMQIEWAWHIFQRTGNRVLILTPLCVAEQLCEEGSRLGYDVKYHREFKRDGSTGLYVTNYEMIHEFIDAIRDGYFDGIVLDESSVIKHKDSKTRNLIIEIAKDIPYRLSCTATPSPNDHMEIGNQAEFLGIMRMTEMLSMFFTHDSGETSKWRLKGHGQSRFWQWLATWACVIKKPSDIGFSDSRHVLRGLKIHKIRVPSVHRIEDNESLSGRNEARRITIDERVKAAIDIVNGSDEKWIVWCNLNDESKKLSDGIAGSVEVKGSDSIASKERNISAFSHGEIRVIVTKPSIAGFGLNWQHCHNMVFVGLNDSFEQLYQAIRRCYRFGQKEIVNVFLISSDLEGAVLENIDRKEKQAETMSQEMENHMRDFVKKEIAKSEGEKTDYNPSKSILFPGWMSPLCH